MLRRLLLTVNAARARRLPARRPGRVSPHPAYGFAAARKRCWSSHYRPAAFRPERGMSGVRCHPCRHTYSYSRHRCAFVARWHEEGLGGTGAVV